MAKHPNLVRLSGVMVAAPTRIVMEFCAGGDLFRLLHVDNMEPALHQKLKMCTDVASGMDYLHRFPPPIIHRDLKSLNLLLSEAVRTEADQVEVKVSDFGLSRALPSDSQRGRGLTPGAGTLNWMAPEVLAGGHYDEKVDVYSYAMVMFEIICLELPFDDEDEACIPRLVAQGSRPDLEAVPPDCPRFLAQLMMGCWAHNPAQRPGFERVLRILNAAVAALN